MQQLDYSFLTTPFGLGFLAIISLLILLIILRFMSGSILVIAREHRFSGATSDQRGELAEGGGITYKPQGSKNKLTVTILGAAETGRRGSRPAEIYNLSDRVGHTWSYHPKGVATVDKWIEWLKDKLPDDIRSLRNEKQISSLRIRLLEDLQTCVKDLSPEMIPAIPKDVKQDEGVLTASKGTFAQGISSMGAVLRALSKLRLQDYIIWLVIGAAGFFAGITAVAMGIIKLAHLVILLYLV